MKLNVEETLNTIKFSELAQKGYKVMSNSEFDRIVEGVIQLQQENQQLKELNSELISVLKAVRKDINFPELCDGYLVIDILDKVKELENKRV